MSLILAFAGSNSSVSINFKLVNFTTSLIQSHQVQLLNLSNYRFPMYSFDEEKNNGYDATLLTLKMDILNSDGLVLAVNEHNSLPSAYFKNMIDWLSRLDKNFLLHKKIFLIATSGGKRGAMSALEVVKNLLPRFGGEIVATFSLPSFEENFDETKGIINKELAEKHQDALELFLSKL